jgi:hypothetical protein
MVKTYKLYFFILLLACTALQAQNDKGIDDDIQMWNVLRFTVPFGEKWSVSMQNEARLSDDISTLDEYVFKLYGHYKFTKKVGLSFGYKYI